MIDKLSTVPRKPGVYIFKNREEKVLYVGKAKDLKNRLRSYFQKASALDDRKTAMIKAVHDFEYTVTGNELEALVLEANLIKQYKPRFNVLLRDDKSYPYLKLTIQDEWPRLEVVRRIQKDGAKYYGPYSPAGPMWEILSFIRNTFPVRTCSHSLEKRLRPCIQHQIRKCAAPCAGLIGRKKYIRMISEIRLLLEGRNRHLLTALESQMERLSGKMQYEEAALIRDRIHAVKKISESQKAVAPGLGDADVIGMYRTGQMAVFKILFVRNGIMIGARDFTVKGLAGEPDPSVMKGFFEQFYGRERLLPGEVLCSVKPDDSGYLAAWLSGERGSRLKIAVPRKGLKKRLVEMAEENAVILAGSGADIGSEYLLRGAARMLGLDNIPATTGAFDISNIIGKQAVGAFVFWSDGEFQKAKYRRIRMDMISGPDDYAMMQEMLRRIISNLGSDLPDLCIIDGGRGHLGAALEVMQQQGVIHGRSVISIAKDPDRVFLPGRETPVGLGGSSAPCLFLRRMRDEAHRFAVGYHRNMRDRDLFSSSLEKIPGIGRNRRFALLRHFDTIDAIKNATVEEICLIKGFNRKTAEEILRHLNARVHEKTYDS